MSEPWYWMQDGDPRKRVKYPRDLMYIKDITMGGGGSPVFAYNEGTLQDVPVPTAEELRHCYDAAGPHCAEAKKIMYRVRAFSGATCDINSDMIYNLAVEFVTLARTPNFLCRWGTNDARYHKKKYAYLNQMALEIILSKVEMEQEAEEADRNN